MPRLVIILKRKLVADSPPTSVAPAPAPANAMKGPSSSSPFPSPPETKPPSPKQPQPQPQPREKVPINCVLNTHVTHLSADSENSTDSGSSDDLDLHSWIRRKTPKKKPSSPSAGAPRRTSRGSKNMDGSGGSPLSNYNDGVNRPILRSMVKKRPHSESLKTDSYWFTDPQAMGGLMAAPPAEMELPKIQIELSRREKEEDFFSFDGAKLPLRPRRRPKQVEKALQNCFPGMSLEDVTKARYEVRERKNVKKMGLYPPKAKRAERNGRHRLRMTR